MQIASPQVQETLAAAGMLTASNELNEDMFIKVHFNSSSRAPQLCEALAGTELFKAAAEHALTLENGKAMIYFDAASNAKTLIIKSFGRFCTTYVFDIK